MGRREEPANDLQANKPTRRRRRTRDADQITDVAEEEAFDSALTESIRARWLFWSETGDLAPDLIMPQVNPIYKNVPAWPSDRLAFLTIERDVSTIITTDGLSDPFESGSQGSQGYGIELFMDLAERPLSEQSRTIAVETLMTAAYNTVARGGLDDLLEEHGVFSMEFPESDLPATHLTADGSAGVLLGGPLAEFSADPILGPLGDIELISITLLTGRETELIRRNGAGARAEIAQNLLEAGIGHRSVVGRPSIIQ
ncbi:MAG: hypothetical protein COA52_19975 [Hyphomicrobiales bacterium]|nr:MAG: hypothetical protein COA52_19975 [Hyphomicrobiales bacterium]